ncbi:hypothetical protein [Chitinophaga sancti]|uniref:Uncharacterized protein n=1 Tax=Chitinophaga sancti TaxID=1004 RepID=A0A1K1SBS4_9BACT|nr:hypothetical protein [Chitinophaga sancti]WQD63575.1 hypothetical protein U0033_04145 [Chitinophaga sancti]WQG90799.1 hypothetical protein SR876_04770 [Chitinophaga sancti]SFW81817.1 hypothetical protein SAMN05661012_05147 [Chitinophaga sancti]
MTKKDIIKSIRSKIDDELRELGFVYKSKTKSYVKFDKETLLYFEISLLFLDYLDYKDASMGKYAELYVDVYHKEISDILLDTSTRSFLGSIFYFKIVGNLLADIILNSNISDYKKRNNFNYFKLNFPVEMEPEALDAMSLKLLSIVKQHVVPFFNTVDTLEKIVRTLDQSYESTLSLHNGNDERLRALVVLLFRFKEDGILEKIQRIKTYFLSINHSTALVELDNILMRYN